VTVATVAVDSSHAVQLRPDYAGLTQATASVASYVVRAALCAAVSA
jgi:hypothetical protein